MFDVSHYDRPHLPLRNTSISPQPQSLTSSPSHYDFDLHRLSFSLNITPSEPTRTHTHTVLHLSTLTTPHPWSTHSLYRVFIVRERGKQSGAQIYVLVLSEWKLLFSSPVCSSANQASASVMKWDEKHSFTATTEGIKPQPGTHKHLQTQRTDFAALLHMTTTVASLYPSAHELLAGESLEVQRFHKLYFGFRGRKLTRLQLICEPGHCEARNPFRDFWFCNIFAWLSTSLKYCRSLHFFISYLKTNWL